MNLYEVYLKGNLERFRPAYVVANSMNEAYEIVFDWLSKKNYGFPSDRALYSIKIIAQESEYTDYERLFISEKKVDEEI